MSARKEFHMNPNAIDPTPTSEPNYYAIIPAEVRYDKGLTANAKLLYGELTALCNKEGYCWANNDYFANLYGTSKKTISRWISSLVENQYISSTMIYKDNTREILYREIRILPLARPILKNVAPYGQNGSTLPPKTSRGRDKKVKDNNTYNITIPWFIMTSQENDQTTKDFFAEHKYFGYPQKSITFFTQGKLPIINTEGKLILDQPYHIKEASNGNGNVFVSLRKHDILNLMEKQGIKWISFGGIDNVLLKNVDPLFLGMTISKKEQIASKSIFKEQPLEKTAVYCKKDGKPAILDYVDITPELSVEKDLD